MHYKSGQIFWTEHAKFKMHFYKLSESRVKSVLKNPERIEEGIAENTIAMMQTNKTSNKPYEIWVMVNPKPLRVISAWKYPGKTKPGESLPQAILREFSEGLKK